jgi:hypothetical protein
MAWIMILWSLIQSNETMNIVSFEYLDLRGDNTRGFINHPEECALTLKDKSSITQYKRLQRCYREKSINMLPFELVGQHLTTDIATLTSSERDIANFYTHQAEK